MPSRRTAALYVCLSLGFSGLYWLLAVLAPEAMKRSEWAVASTWGTVAWAVLRTFGPALTGVLALAIVRGKPAVVELGRSIVRWRVSPRFYLLALYPVVLNVVALLVGRGRFEPHLTLTKAVLFFFLTALLDGPLGEEIGWRGVLLPQLVETMRPLTAAIIVGVVWYLWHVPLYAADGRYGGAGAQALFAASCIALSIIFTWFWLRTNGSTFFAIYLHTCSNYFTFLRMKLFVMTDGSQWPRVVYYTLLLAITVFAAVQVARAPSKTAA